MLTLGGIGKSMSAWLSHKQKSLALVLPPWGRITYIYRGKLRLSPPKIEFPY